MFTILERVTACFHGVATGDAIGKQTETLPHREVSQWYPDGVHGFEGEPGAVIPRYRGNRKREWRIGETTDDTERTIAVARAIIADGRISHVSIGRAMLGCTKGVHSGVRSLWAFHEAGDPARTTTEHDGCGAAVRVSPVGVFYSSQALDDLVTGAREASVSTHGGSLAVAAAAATAAAVSSAIDGADAQQVFSSACEAAVLSERKWPGGSPFAFTTALRAVHGDLAALPALTPAAVAATCFPDHPLTIVPLALSLGTIMRSAEEAILLAANVGGDSDSVASVAAAVLGAMYPATINDGWVHAVETVNRLELSALAHELASLRRRPFARPPSA